MEYKSEQKLALQNLRQSTAQQHTGRENSKTKKRRRFLLIIGACHNLLHFLSFHIKHHHHHPQLAAVEALEIEL